MRFKSYREYYEHFKRLILLEREAEIEFHRREIRKLPGWKREKLGRAILNLRGKLVGRGLGGTYLVKYVRQGGLPQTEIKVGDLVIASRGKPKGNEIQGTVVEKTRFSLTVAYDKHPPDYALGKGIRIDLFANDITFQRMLDALKALREHPDLLNLLLGRAKPEITETEVEFKNTSLNGSQRTAVKKAIGSKPAFLVHGPPGTGKTTTVVEAIYQYAARGKKVLATADSNVATDNMVERLAAYGINVVRVGNPSRITKAVVEHSLDYLLQYDEDYKKALKIYEEVDRLRQEQKDYLAPVPRWRRGLSDDEILRHAETGTPVRGVHPNAIRKMAAWIKLQKRINHLMETARKYEAIAVERILRNADVVCSTNSSAGSEVLAHFRFDVVFIDEATQSTEPSCLIPMVKGNVWIMAGDHKQLPPTILSEEAAKHLQITLFERLLKVYGDRIKEMLRVQYRMNRVIMDFPNRMFYGGKLIAHESVANHTLRDLGVTPEVLKGLPKPLPFVLDPDRPVIFADTLGRSPERQRRGSTSYYNEGEAEFVLKVVRALLDLKVRPEDIGVISPYDDQVDLIRGVFHENGIPEEVEVKTVDGFQGREKEVIVVSFVRSNDRGEIGFLNDVRRLNVAITRPKRKLITVGDSLTLKVHPVYDGFVRYSRKVKGYVPV